MDKQQKSSTALPIILGVFVTLTVWWWPILVVINEEAAMSLCDSGQNWLSCWGAAAGFPIITGIVLGLIALITLVFLFTIMVGPLLILKGVFEYFKRK